VLFLYEEKNVVCMNCSSIRLGVVNSKVESQCTVMVKSFQHFDFAGGGGGVVGGYGGGGLHLGFFFQKAKYF